MNNKTIKLTMAGMFCAVAVVGSLVSFPVFGSKCAPVQHLINILCAVFLGPAYGVGVAFAASFIRNITGLGTLLAFPGSMSGVIGGLCAYPVAILLMGKDISTLAFYVYIVPFLISTVGGAVIAAVILYSLKQAHVLKQDSTAA